jgi:hypothetical protein
MTTGAKFFRQMIWAAIQAAALLVTPTTLLAAATAVTSTQSLNFGKFAGGSGYSGTVTIDTTGARSSSGSVIRLGTVFSPARFTITGNPGKAYTLTLPAAFTITSGTNQMNVTAVTASIPLSGAIPTGGELPFVVGGTLTVNSTQKNGIYSGALMISVK